VRIVAPNRVYDLPFVSQVYILFRAQMTDPRFQTTLESSEVRLINEEDVPWDAIAFPVIRETLKGYFKDRKNGQFEFLNLQLNTEEI